MTRYSAVQKAIHWSVLVLCIGQIPTSWAIHRTHMAGHFGLRPDPFDLFLHQVHAWSGWLVLGLAGIGLLLRLIKRPAPVGTNMASRLAAVAAHWALYGLLAALAVTGTLAMYISGYFAPIHDVLTKLLLAMAILHSVAALLHHFVWRDGVLRAMLPQLGKR